MMRRIFGCIVQRANENCAASAFALLTSSDIAIIVFGTLNIESILSLLNFCCSMKSISFWDIAIGFQSNPFSRINVLWEFSTPPYLLLISFLSLRSCAFVSLFSVVKILSGRAEFIKNFRFHCSAALSISTVLAAATSVPRPRNILFGSGYLIKTSSSCAIANFLPLPRSYSYPLMSVFSVSSAKTVKRSGRSNRMALGTPASSLPINQGASPASSR